MRERSATRRLGAAIVVTAAIAFWPGDARADGLRYHAPEGCPGGLSVRDQWRTELARRGAAETEAVTILIERRDGGFVGTLVVGEGRRERSLEASSCDELVSGLLLVLALGSAPERSAPPAAASEAAVPATPRGVARNTPRVFVALGAGATGGLQPSVAPTASLSGGVALGRFVGEGGATTSLANHGTLEGRPEGAAFTAVTAGARACFSVAARFVLGPCLGADAIVLRGGGEHASVVHVVTSTTVAPAASLRGSLFLGDHVALALDAKAAVPLQRPEFTIDAEALHRSSAITWQIVLRTELWL